MDHFKRKMKKNRTLQPFFGFPAPNEAKLYVMTKVIITMVLKTLVVHRNIKTLTFFAPEQLRLFNRGLGTDTIFLHFIHYWFFWH